MEALKSYPSYRDSGLPWMGQLPTSWQVIRSKYLFREVADRTDTGTETLLSMRQAHGLIPHAKVSTKPVTPEELKGYRRVRAGQMVLNRMQASNGMFAMAREDGLVSPDYAVFQALQPMEPDFFVQLFKTSVYRAKFRQESKGLGTGTSGFLRLYSDRFGAIQVPNPSQDEQRRIVEFVRGYDLGVRRLIRNKRRLIGLFNEQKQAIINQAVTRGLNPNVPMKLTGIDWMPEVPAHWEVKPLKHWLRERAKALGDKTSPEYEFDYLDISCVGTGFLTAKPERMKFEDAPSRARQIVQKGDTILSTVRTYLKAVYFIENDWPDLIASTGFAVLRPVEQVEPRLLGYVLQSSTFIERVIRASIGVAYPAISEGRLGMLHVAFSPHLAEQKAILDHIAAETAAFDEAIEKAQSEIALIREYRERLIADVVTGKLDVRNVEIAEPAEEPIADDEALEEEGDDTEVLEGADADD